MISKEYIGSGMWRYVFHDRTVELHEDDVADIISELVDDGEEKERHQLYHELSLLDEEYSVLEFYVREAKAELEVLKSRIKY